MVNVGSGQRVSVGLGVQVGKKGVAEGTGVGVPVVVAVGVWLGVHVAQWVSVGRMVRFGVQVAQCVSVGSRVRLGANFGMEVCIGVDEKAGVFVGGALVQMDVLVGGFDGASVAVHAWEGVTEGRVNGRVTAPLIKEEMHAMDNKTRIIDSPK